MQVWNVLHAARWKYRTQKIAKKSPSAHHRTICRAISSQIRHISTIGKKLLNSNPPTRPHNMVNFGRPTNGWDQFVNLGHPSRFQRVSRLGFVTAATSLNRSQPNFARCLAVSWAATLYIHFRGLLPLNEILPGAKFTLRPSLTFSYIGIVSARHSSNGVSQTLGPWAEGATYIR